jgi:hypothetical protein
VRYGTKEIELDAPRGNRYPRNSAISARTASVTRVALLQFSPDGRKRQTSAPTTSAHRQMNWTKVFTRMLA